MYQVVKKDGRVIKVPRTLKHTDWEQEAKSLKIHKDHLWDSIPDTDIDIDNDKSWRFETHQDLIQGTPVNLATTTNQQVLDLLEAGATMQEEEKILFDVFGLEWMVRLFSHYFDGSPLWFLNDVTLPINMEYLKGIHNFPPELLQQLKEKDWEPFIAHNIIEWVDGKIHFIDTDHRPLTLLGKPNPLNHVWRWITAKALKDLERKRNK